MRVVIPVAASAGTTVFLFVPFLVWWLVKRQNNNNEREPLLPNNAVDQIHNLIRPNQESSVGRSQPVPIGSSCGKADINAHV